MTPRKSRRYMLAPWLWTKHPSGSTEYFERAEIGPVTSSPERRS
jgi:hypothetical protein